ncbi:hypothetical protein ABZ772_21750 [Streptomyces griseoincarnatus]
MAGVTQNPEAWARLGAVIRERRESMGMSRRQLSQVANVSEKSIQVAEEGRTPRARWPQSLHLIEAALRWEEGSMVNVLEGGEPTETVDLFTQEHIPTPELRIPLGPAIEEETAGGVSGLRGRSASNYSRSTALASLPKGIREALGTVLDFGRKAASYGADLDAVERYEDATEALLLDLVGRPLEWDPLHGPGRLKGWRAAMRMDPVLRRERRERALAAERGLRQTEVDRAQPYRRTPIVGDTDMDEIMRAVQRLAVEVTRLAEKVEREEKGSGSSE